MSDRTIIQWVLLDDWYGLYKDGVLYSEGHNMEATHAMWLGISWAAGLVNLSFSVFGYNGDLAQHGHRMPDNFSELNDENLEAWQ